ncbi:hypothetical protein MHYP_G00259980 [Metynnis hypsauchen]
MSPRGASPPVVGRHWAKLRYVAFGEAPNRSEERALQSFTQIFDAGVGNGFWKNWELDTSAPQDVRFVYVKFWTGRVADADVEQYLRRYCEILQPVFKPLDQFGLWYGVRRYKVKLRYTSDGNLYQIPNSISLGPYNGRISYPAQNGEDQEDTASQTSDVIQEAQNSIEGPLQINNGEETKSSNSTTDSSDTSSSGSSDSSSEVRGFFLLQDIRKCHLAKKTLEPG